MNPVDLFNQVKEMIEKKDFDAAKKFVEDNKDKLGEYLTLSIKSKVCFKQTKKSILIERCFFIYTKFQILTRHFKKIDPSF